MPDLRHRSLTAAGFILVCTIIAACSLTSNDRNPASRSIPAAISITPGAGARDVDPATQVRVATSNGVLSAVTMTNEQGRAIDGIMTPDKTEWKPALPLEYGSTYTLRAEGTSASGAIEPVVSTFSTLRPRNQTKVYPTTTGGQPLTDGGTYGIGTVVVAHFDEDIPDRAAAEKRLSISTEPAVEGSWYWLDNRNAHWRPREYFRPGTTVTFTAKIFGTQLGPGLFGQEDSTTRFTIGPAHVSIADDNTKQVQVYDNGQLVRTMPTSMGMGGSEVIAGKTISFWTQPGIYTVIGKANPVVMDSSTYGLPVNSRLGYKESINWATQISTDGIYLHQLDSTVWAQGNTNTSHGCLNLNQDNAQWFYDFSQPGDVVEIRNTGGDRLQVWQNGDWAVPWEQWQQRSALR